MYRREKTRESSSDRNLVSFVDQTIEAKDRGKNRTDGDISSSIETSLLHEPMEPGEIADRYRLDDMEKGKYLDFDFHQENSMIDIFFGCVGVIFFSFSFITFGLGLYPGKCEKIIFRNSDCEFTYCFTF